MNPIVKALAKEHRLPTIYSSLVTDGFMPFSRTLAHIFFYLRINSIG